MPRAFGSIRVRITMVATVLMAIVLVLTGVLSVQTQRRALTSRVDEQLEHRADEVTGLVERGTVDEALAVEGGDETFTQIVTSDGQVVAASANFDGPALPNAWVTSSGQAFRTVDDVVPVDDDEFRVLTRRITTSDGTLALHVGVAFDDVVESLAVLTRTLAVLFPVVLVVLALLIWVVVGRALRPVEAMRAEVARISGRELDRRVPQPAARDEIGRLAGTMNEMLDRVEDAHRRQARFVADASHELRSPLTGIRSELEVDLAHPERADLTATHRSVLEEAVRLQRLVDDLLYMARSHDGVRRLRTATVDVDELVFREVEALRARGGVVVDAGRVSGAQLTGDADQLTRAVRNLLDNAERHAESTVTVTLGERGDEIELMVADDGPGVPPDQAEEIFERFARIDDSRARASGGTGLGLAITREIVANHGGTVVLDATADAGARFVVRLPRAPSAAADTR